MNNTHRLLAAIAAVAMGCLPLAACAGTRPTNLGSLDGSLAPCPSSPNCVSSDADDAHHAAPFQLSVEPAEGWRVARDAVLALPRTRIVSETHGYLHAECRSALLGFVDDLELRLPTGTSVIEVRSASRLGYSDRGVNRDRVETLRAGLTLAGVLR